MDVYLEYCVLYSWIMASYRAWAHDIPITRNTKHNVIRSLFLNNIYYKKDVATLVGILKFVWILIKYGSKITMLLNPSITVFLLLLFFSINRLIQPTLELSQNMNSCLLHFPKLLVSLPFSGLFNAHYLKGLKFDVQLFCFLTLNQW